MGQIHACFVSYRHPATPDGREGKLIQHVVRAIKDHIEMLTHEHDVYFDRARLVPGYQYDERLAKAICRSACMVVVYWPSYLESEYCKKEIRTMLAIEANRRSILGSTLHGCRLFIPLILRGRFDDLPTGLREGCHYLDYKAQAIRPDFNIGDDPIMSEQLYGVAEYIKELCDKMKCAEESLFGRCENFVYGPSSADAFEAPAAIQPFPGR